MKDFNEAVDELLKKVSRDVTLDISYQIQDAYDYSIKEFYKDYIPHSYKRTGATFEASNKYNWRHGSIMFSPKVRMQHDGSYIGGIIVDPHNIQGMPYRASKTWVFNRTFYEGIHGVTDSPFSSAEIPTMSPTPEQIMDKMFNKLTKDKRMDKLVEKYWNKYTL